jgi:predicted amidohydrolase
MSTLRIAFLHLAPCLSDLQASRRLVDRAVTTAAAYGATWILTPELCICGYDFTDDLGTAWIVPPPDPWMASLCQRAAHFGVTVFLSHPERDGQSGKCYNTLFVIAADGCIVGKHRKIRHCSKDSGSCKSPACLV